MAAAPGGGGCATSFYPVVPMSARSGDIELSTVAWRPAKEREVVISSRSPSPQQIRGAWMTVPTRAPCSGGAKATQIEVDRQPLSGAPLAPGAHEIRARFEAAGDDFELGLVVDLQLPGGACARVPAVSESVPMEARGRMVWIWGSTIDFNTNLSGLFGIVGFTVGGGAWFGPALVTAATGLAVSTCIESVCGRQKDGSLNSDWAWPFLLEARLPVGIARSGAMHGIPMVGLRYSAASVGVPATNGDRRFVVQGLYGVLSWSLLEVPRGPFRHIERASSMELSVPIGVLFDPAGPSNQRVAFSAGLGFRFAFPL